MFPLGMNRRHVPRFLGIDESHREVCRPQSMVFHVWAGRYLSHGAQKPHRHRVGCFLGEPTDAETTVSGLMVVCLAGQPPPHAGIGVRNILMVGVGKTRNIMEVTGVIAAKLDDLLVGFRIIDFNEPVPQFLIVGDAPQWSLVGVNIHLILPLVTLKTPTQKLVGEGYHCGPCGVRTHDLRIKSP